MEFIVEEDFVVGTVPLVPLEPFESLELFGDLSVLELVFLRRSSLKKGIVVWSISCIIQRGRVSSIESKYGRAHGGEHVAGPNTVKKDFSRKRMPNGARSILGMNKLRVPMGCA